MRVWLSEPAQVHLPLLRSKQDLNENVSGQCLGVVLPQALSASPLSRRLVAVQAMRHSPGDFKPNGPMERSGQFHADAEEARTYPVSQHRDVRCFGQPDSAIDLDSIPAILLPRSKEDETEPEHVHASASMAS